MMALSEVMAVPIRLTETSVESEARVAASIADDDQHFLARGGPAQMLQPLFNGIVKEWDSCPSRTFGPAAQFSLSYS
jgi:hypothetical protein